MHSYSFNSSIKPHYINNQHFIRKQQIHKLYKKDNSYKVNNHCVIIPIKFDKSPQLDNSMQVNPGRALFSRCRKLQCSICLEKLYKTDCSTLECNHKFHIGCINEWRKVSNTCPFCRAIIRSHGVNMNNPEIFGHSGPFSYIERTMIIALDSINEHILFGTPVERPHLVINYTQIYINTNNVIGGPATSNDVE